MPPFQMVRRLLPITEGSFWTKHQSGFATSASSFRAFVKDGDVSRQPGKLKDVGVSTSPSAFWAAAGSVYKPVTTQTGPKGLFCALYPREHLTPNSNSQSVLALKSIDQHLGHSTAAELTRLDRLANSSFTSLTAFNASGSTPSVQRRSFTTGSKLTLMPARQHSLLPSLGKAKRGLATPTEVVTPLPGKAQQRNYAELPPPMLEPPLVHPANGSIGATTQMDPSMHAAPCGATNQASKGAACDTSFLGRLRASLTRPQLLCLGHLASLFGVVALFMKVGPSWNVGVCGSARFLTHKPCPLLAGGQIVLYRPSSFVPIMLQGAIC
jgi:hypothetical protein